jgi:hypothetical protein
MAMLATQVKLVPRDRRENLERRATEERREPQATQEFREPRATEDHRDLMDLLVQLVNT